ncbi:MAG: nucleotide exchange factor GrpE [Paludibacteraceae bacterium]|nr:nucleotide exchange factor GrpE [Paludibacteraceae bacterium]
MSKKNKINDPQAEPQGDNVALDNEETLNAEEQQTIEAQQDLEKELETLRDKCADLADKNLRMMAEFDNYRRRTNKEKLDLMTTAGERIFKDMLPLIDDFERARQAMQTTEDIQALREGIDLIYQKFISFLEKNSVKVIETENADFDTEFHEAVTTFPAPTPEQKGKVIDCTQKGYTLGEKVIRYAKVVVGE